MVYLFLKREVAIEELKKDPLGQIIAGELIPLHVKCIHVYGDRNPPPKQPSPKNNVSSLDMQAERFTEREVRSVCPSNVFFFLISFKRSAKQLTYLGGGGSNLFPVKLVARVRV